MQGGEAAENLSRERQEKETEEDTMRGYLEVNLKRKQGQIVLQQEVCCRRFPFEYK